MEALKIKRILLGGKSNSKVGIAGMVQVEYTGDLKPHILVSVIE
jgi:hypothetical protein